MEPGLIICPYDPTSEPEQVVPVTIKKARAWPEPGEGSPYTSRWIVVTTRANPVGGVVTGVRVFEMP